MTDPAVVVLEVSRIEAIHLASLVEQFIDLLDASDRDARVQQDPAIARLVPDAYTGDLEASREFRSLTQADLLRRRDTDARAVLSSLGEQPTTADAQDSPGFSEMLVVTLDPDAVQAWMRTLASVRLVIASRLGIETEDDHDEGDPRFGIYDWLGFRLDALVRAATGPR